LGTELTTYLRRNGASVVSLTHRQCDITDPAALARTLESLDPAPNTIINAAAYTDVDGAEENAERAFAVNAQGPQNIGRVACTLGARVLSFSTDFVFAGRRTGPPYREEDPPDPQSTYARSKLAGDRNLRSTAPDCWILRVGNLYGRHGNNFPSTLVARFRKGQHLKIDRSRRMTPTSTLAVAAQTWKILVAQPPGGLYHVTCQGEATWADFADAVCRKTGLNPSFERVTSTALNLKAPRPAYHVLENARLQDLGLDIMPAWPAALDAYLSNTQNPTF
jgi:dTDP-4-dehydrorhamnose reductase